MRKLVKRSMEMASTLEKYARCSCSCSSCGCDSSFMNYKKATTEAGRIADKYVFGNASSMIK